MGERSDGTWSAKQVGLSVPRQNGKSQLIVARALAGALLFGEKKIVISAHQQDTARETFAKFLEMRDESPSLAERMPEKGIMRALNRESLRFTNGAFIQFKARSVSGGRGFSSDCLLLDEAQILGMPSWVSINSTMSARSNPQVWLMGTPPTPEDNGEVFTSIRSAAIDGRSQTLAWLEWAAGPNDDPSLELTRASGNPAWHSRINHEIVQGEYETYPPERFALDRLGIWPTESRDLPVDPSAWSDLESEPAAGAPSYYALSMSPERVAAIGVAVPDGESRFVDLAELDRVDDTRLLIEWLVKRCGRRTPVAIDSRDPAASLVNELRERKVKVNTFTTADCAKACGALVDAVAEGRISHVGQPAIASALSVARKKPIGKAGLWEWDLEDPTAEMAALRAVTLAHFGATFTKPRTNRVVMA